MKVKNYRHFRCDIQNFYFFFSLFNILISINIYVLFFLLIKCYEYRNKKM